MVTKAQMRKIQTLKHQVAWLCKDRATWEQFLTSCAGRLVSSSTQLSLREAIKVIDALQQQISGAGSQASGRPNNFNDDDRNKQLKYIEHLLKGRGWAYADGLARRICKVEKLAWVRSGDLRKIIAALKYDQGRKLAAASRELRDSG